MPKDKVDVYGRRPVVEALRAGHVEEVFLARETRNSSIMREIEEEAARAAVPLRHPSRAELDRLLPGRNHQGVAARLTRRDEGTLEDVLGTSTADQPGLLLALDGIQDPGNVGSLIRTADGAGAQGVIIPRHRAAGVTPAVTRASAGAAEHLPIAVETNMTRALRRLKDEGYWIVGLDGAAERRYHSIDARRPLVLVVGGEGDGISRLVRDTCDELVSLPMYGHVGSLNAAVAGAIMLYEVRRQRDV